MKRDLTAGPLRWSGRTWLAADCSRLGIHYLRGASVAGRAYPGRAGARHAPVPAAEQGRSGEPHYAPALKRLCPVQAYLDWISIAGLARGRCFAAWIAGGT